MSIYNDISVKNEPVGRIIVDCAPDQYRRDTVNLDQEDYERIQTLAKELGWTK